MPLPGRVVGLMRCGLLMTNLGALLRFRSASCAAKGLHLGLPQSLGNEGFAKYAHTKIPIDSPTAPVRSCKSATQVALGAFKGRGRRNYPSLPQRPGRSSHRNWRQEIHVTWGRCHHKNGSPPASPRCTGNRHLVLSVSLITPTRMRCRTISPSAAHPTAATRFSNGITSNQKIPAFTFPRRSGLEAAELRAECHHSATKKRAPRQICESISLLSFAFILLLAILVAAAILALRQTGAQADVQKSIEVINGLSTVLTELLDAETGQRGYVVSGDPSYLGPYNKAACGW
jgi:hypothetical protein